jgi:hypothetical protein
MVRCACGCDGLPKTFGVRQPRVEIGGEALFGHIPRAFNLVALARPIPLRVFRPVPAIQSPASDRINIAKCTRVGNVGVDDIAAVVEWCARVWPQG